MSGKLRVLIVHNAVATAADAAENDVLTQVDVVRRACEELGYSAAICACSLDLSGLLDRLQRDQPDVVFNLVESLASRDQLAWLVPAFLETLGIPCTGTKAAALNLSNDKPRTKERLRLVGLPTPEWYTADSLSGLRLAQDFKPGRYILKSSGEHASLGLDDSAIVSVLTAEELRSHLERQSAKLGKPCFAEQFIEGREFNLSLLAEGSGAEVLPPAEIDFSAFPPGKPRIVGYAAKWEEGAFEFTHTPRRFDFADDDQALLAQLKTLARSCWRVLELGGWVRVDFRVSTTGQPFILEVNTNPCLSPDAGFAAAVQQAGMTFPRAVERIIAAALPESQQAPSTSKPAASGTDSVQLRTTVSDNDIGQVREIVASTGMFRTNEVHVAAELVEVRLRDGVASGYEFVFADRATDRGHEVLGYACFGLNTVTVGSYDLYWIAVRPEMQGQGLGQRLLAAVEERVIAAGGQRIYIETSLRPDYAPTRHFYERCGYVLEAILRDFYAPGDDKAVFVRRFS